MDNKTKDRTMIHIIVLLVCSMFFVGFYVTTKQEQITEQTQKQQTVIDVIYLVKDNDILIKNETLAILFKGTTVELKQEKQYLDKEVIEMAVCEDDENNNTLTIFIK